MTEATNILVNSKVQSARTHAIICYVLMLLSFFFGITSLIGLIWAYIARNEAKSTFAESHFDNIISVFWFSIMWFCLAVFSAMLVGVFGGGIVAGIAAIWILFRLIKGVVRVTSYKSFNELPVPQL